MNRFKCPHCGGNQYSASNDTDRPCIYCGHQGLELMDMLESENEGGKMINCQYYVPAWAGNKTTSSQPDWCLKHGVILNGKCLKNCNEKKDVRNSELQGEVHA